MPAAPPGPTVVKTEHVSGGAATQAMDIGLRPFAAQSSASAAPAGAKNGELLVAVGSLENVVGFVTVTADMTLEAVRQLIDEEIDDECLPPSGWKFMSLHGPAGRVVPISTKQEKKILGSSVLPTVVIDTPPSVSSSSSSATQQPVMMPFTTPAPSSASSEAAGMSPGTAARPLPPPRPRFSSGNDNHDDDDGERENLEKGLSRSRSSRGLKRHKENEEDDDLLDMSDDDDDDDDGSVSASPPRKRLSKGKDGKGKKRLELESDDDEEDGGEVEMSDDGDDDEVIEMVESEEEDEEVAVQEEEGAEQGALIKMNLPSVRQECNGLLQRLQDELERARQQGAALRNTDQYREEIQETILRSVLLDTKIGVVGDTGAGKSSLLNALVHEESVLETSGWRACTAVCIELTYLQEGEGYMGEIHFLTKDEWEAELDDLLSEALNDERKLKRVFEGESPQAVAVDKLTTVYGEGIKGSAISKQMLGYRTQITRRLGEVMVVREANATDFRKKLAPYVASTDRQSQAYWPIIKKICLRSSHWKVLEQGGVLVDLPGLRDANAARARVCETYKKNCSLLLICAPIHRAVDNRTAKDLLGEQFRRQILLDDQMSNLAFCATKADDVNPTEILKDFDEMPPEIKTLLNKQDEVNSKVRELKQTIKDLRRGRAELLTKRKDLKRLREVERDLEEVEKRDEGAGDDDEMEVVLEPGALKEEREKLSSELKEIGDPALLDREIKAVERTLNKLEVEKRGHQRQMNAACARVRHTTSKREIRRDFRMGLLEIQEESEAEGKAPGSRTGG